MTRTQPFRYANFHDLLKRDDLRMGKVRFGHDRTRLDFRVELAGTEKRIVTQVAADPRPLDRFQRHAIRARQPR